jgi:hypothetical protein
LHAGFYTEAIGLSLDMADKGITFSESAITFTRRLLEQPPTKDELITIIAAMSSLAEQGREAAKATNLKFKLVRSGLIQVCVRHTRSIQY